jgi:three-Cys-motif partner protein
MSDLPFQPDEIGYWSELKLEIVEKYGQGYTNAFNKLGARLTKYYIDGFSGAGVHVSKRTGEPVEGSPARALKIKPPFDRFYFIDMNADKTAYLETTRAGRTNVEIHTGDTNPYLKTLLPTIKYTDYKRALCLLDPYGLHLDWDVMHIAGQLQTVDMFLNFPIMHINRNVLRHDPAKAVPEDIERMTRFWGDDTWRKAGYAETGQTDLFGGEPETAKQDNPAIAEAFRTRLRDLAGFKYVPTPLPMRNRNKAVIYYLFFASANDTGRKIVEDIFSRYRHRT